MFFNAFNISKRIVGLLGMDSIQNVMVEYKSDVNSRKAKLTNKKRLKVIFK